jgi:hypothetical protein
MEVMSNIIPKPIVSIEPLTKDNWDRRTHTCKNEATGLYETYDLVTGDLLVAQAETTQWDLSELTEVEIDGKKILVQRGVDFSRLTSRKQHVYSREIIDVICTKVASGESLTKILKDPVLPSISILSAWRKAHPWIDVALKQAYEMRAEHHRDRALDIAETEAESKLELENQKKEIDIHKWCAVQDAPHRFGNRSNEEVERRAPVYIINTGIVREEPKETKEIMDVIDVVSKE